MTGQRLLLILAAAMALAGCGSVSSGSGPDPGAEAESRDRLRQALNEDETRSKDEEATYTQHRNELMVSCMKDAGFTYRWVVPPKPARDYLGLSEEDFVKQYGFGISTLIDFRDAGIPRTDPNREIRNSLSPAAQKSYDRALDRCAERAMDELGPPPGVLELPANSEFTADLNEAITRASADARVVAARQRYQSCVAVSGFSGTSGEALRGQIEEQVAPFRQAYQARRDELARQGQDVSGLRVAEALDPDQLSKLRQLQQLELRAAAIDRSCGADLYRVAAEVQREYTKKVVDGA